MNKQYIGDGVYVEFDGYGFVLTSENGIEALDRIVLEPDVYHALVRYAENVVDDPASPADMMRRWQKKRDD